MGGQRLRFVSQSLAIGLLGSTAWAGPLIPERPTGPDDSIRLDSPRATRPDPTNEGLRAFVARPFGLEGRTLVVEGLPVDPAVLPVPPATGLAAAPSSLPTVEPAGFDPGTASTLEVPIGPDLASSDFGSTRPPTAPGSRRDPLVARLSDFRAPEPASIILLLTGVIGLTARRHLLRQRA